MWRRYQGLTISIMLLLCLSYNSDIMAQSGRKRPTDGPPKTQPSTQPEQPTQSRPNNKGSEPNNGPKKSEVAQPKTSGQIMIPKGGVLTSQEVSGVTSRYVFKNGLILLVRENHSIPIAASTIYVKAGTANDPEDQTGVTRVIEQLLSEPRVAGGSNDPLRIARQQGAVITSEVTFDATRFSVLGAATNFNKILECQFKSIQPGHFSAEETAKASKIVTQDSRLKLDNPVTYGQQRILQAAFESASLANAPDLKPLTKEQVQASYDKFYRGGNIIVVVTGDVISDQVRVIAQQFLGALEPGGKVVNNQAGADTKTEPLPVRYLAERGDINQTIVSVGYRVPGLKDKDAAIFEVLSALLTRGRSAILPQALIEPSYASNVSAQYIASNKGGLFSFQMQVVPERFVKAEGALFEQIEALRRTILSPGDLLRAKSLLEKAYYDDTMQVTVLSERLAFWEARGGYKNFDSYVQRIKAVTGDQIQEMASQYFNFKDAVVHEFEPKNAPARIAGTDATYTPDRFEAFINVLVPRTHKETVSKDEIIVAPEVAMVKQGRERNQENTNSGFIMELQPQPVKDFSTLRGPRAYVREDQSRPLIAIGFYFQGGRILEKESNSGITELMLRTILRGTAKLNGADIALTLEQLGADLKIINEPDYFGFTLEVLSRNTEAATRLIIDMLENAAFDKAEFAREKASLLAAVRAQRDDGVERPAQLYHSALYGTHPYGLPQLGLDSAVEQMTEDDVSKWYQQSIKHQYPLVVIVGDTDGSSLVGRFLADGFGRRDVEKALSVPAVATRAVPERIESRERRQTGQDFGFFGPEGKNTDNYIMEVVKQIIGGPGGRFQANLQQEEQAFEIDVENQWRQLRGNLSVHINSAPEQEQRARTLVAEEFRKLLVTLPDDVEVEAGRNCAIAYLLANLRSHGARAEAYARNAFFGLPVADIDNINDKLRAIKKEDVQRVVKTFFVENKSSVGILRAVNGQK